MSKSLGGIVILGAVALGLLVFWNPKICQGLNSVGGSLNFDFCDFQSTRPKPHGASGALVDTTVSSPAHKKKVAARHQKLATHNNTAIHAAHKALQKKHAASGHLKANQIGPNGPNCTPICKTVQCAGCPAPTSSPTAKSSLAQAFDYKMSI